MVANTGELCFCYSSWLQLLFTHGSCLLFLFHTSDVVFAKIALVTTAKFIFIDGFSCNCVVILEAARKTENYVFRNIAGKLLLSRNLK